MIIKYFIIDYLIMLVSPFNTYFMLYQLDKNKLVDVIIVGLIIGVIYNKILLSIIVLVILYSLFKIIKINKKYMVFKNIMLFILFYYICNFNNQVDLLLFSISFILQILFIYGSRCINK